MRAMVVATVLLVALAGCGDKSDAPSGDYETPDKEDGAYIIAVSSSNRFSPVHAKVPDGGIVEWQVENTNGCRIKADDGSFDSLHGGGTTFNNGIVPKGSTWRWVADGPGTYAYSCAGLDIKGSLKVA